MKHKHTRHISAAEVDGNYWGNLWHYRELFFFLAWRDITGRYKQASLGLAWMVIRPLLTMLVFTIVFSKLAKLPSDNIPYPILVLTGLLPWQLFASSFSDSSTSIVNNRSMISKVYFPRIIIPISTIIVNVVDFLVGFTLLFMLMCWYDLFPNWKILTLPIFIGTLIIFSIGTSLWISALMVKYKDLRFIVPFTLQFGLYLSPIGFNLSIIPEKWQSLYCLNPIVGIIDGFRWALIDQYTTINVFSFSISLILSLLLFVTGILHFKKNESSFVDEI